MIRQKEATRSVLMAVMLSAGASLAGAATAADAGLKSTTEIVGKCTMATLLGKDITSRCYGLASDIEFRSGRIGFEFHAGGNTVLRFSGGKDDTSVKGQRVVQIDAVDLEQAGEDQGKEPASGTCTEDGDISQPSIIHCRVTTDQGLVEFSVDSTQPASYHDSFLEPAPDDKPMVRYWRFLKAVCIKASVDIYERADECKGMDHVGFGVDRVDFILTIEGHMVAFSGDQEKRADTSDYVLYVNRLYFDKHSTPAAGKCELVGDYQGKSKLTCDAESVSVDAALHAHVEFDVSGLAEHSALSQSMPAH
jgi:hypothetical protein